MSYCIDLDHARPVCTSALRRFLSNVNDDSTESDLLYLERWDMQPLPGAAAALRVAQIRRANPGLAAEIRAELAQGRPLTQAERQALTK